MHVVLDDDVIRRVVQPDQDPLAADVAVAEEDPVIQLESFRRQNPFDNGPTNLWSQDSEGTETREKRATLHWLTPFHFGSKDARSMRPPRRVLARRKRLSAPVKTASGIS